MVAVTITDTTSGATIRYTTDGSAPSESAGTVYTNSFTVISSCTITAIAFKEGMTDSKPSSVAYVVTPKISGFRLTLGQGTYWQFEWKRSTSTFAETGSGTTTTSGIGKITLGAPTTIQGITAYAVAVSGTFPPDHTPAWKYIADSNSRLLKSTDGSTLVDIFNAWTGTNQGGGFFIPFGSANASGAYQSAMSDAFYVNPQTYALGQITNTGGNLYIPGMGTFYSEQPSVSKNSIEYFAPGIGPVGYHYFFSYTDDSDPEAYFSTSTTEDLGLIATSFPQTAQGGSVTGVTINPTTLLLGVRATGQLSAFLQPSDAANQGVTWSSGDTAIASVDQTGLVTGVGPGGTSIKVTTADGGKTATCAVTVQATGERALGKR
jgi:hypothetical protein